MPITPFHFGPGALGKGLVPGMSWTCFALTNVLMDLEPIALFFLIGAPEHRFFHTLPGATLLAALAALLGRRWCERWLSFWNRQLSPRQARWLGCPSRISPRAAWSGALLGAWSHLALDALMHADIRPLWPLLGTNPWVGQVDLDALHWACFTSGLLGLALLAARGIRRRRVD